jgi:hypothetical protein
VSARSFSTATTKKARRQENWGKRNTIRRTRERTYLDMFAHRPPATMRTNAGTRWLGFSKASKRKPLPVEPSWRDWLRLEGIARWRQRRALAAIDAELEELEAA